MCSHFSLRSTAATSSRLTAPKLEILSCDSLLPASPTIDQPEAKLTYERLTLWALTEMFAQPRPKKDLLPPPVKKRKTEHTIEEINFDNDARHEYLTGFRKRKQQRIKRAQEEAEKRAKEERRELRKQVCGTV